ncbi:hypothetical protein BP6252_10457 [Coleophoma cylindrospora]|uniref:Eisosome protein 1 n=1 Tax=Coleophoma cylindrospora TaxID=1849047 RepID=A0A3D8QSK1_9HELO|nr:hypothetical protein BP6252_10457 [Coleophoma cylindrospora]
MPPESVQPHTTSSKLEDQAATAALYVTNKNRPVVNIATTNVQTYLDSDNRLSSAGAAASLKYASPRDLPSYPSSGLKKSDSAAGAAASLGWANQKPFEHWKPDPSASASAAAMLAKDYKMAPLWQPEQSTAGAKAAVLASRDGGKVDVWRPEVTSWGNTAATHAFKKDRTGGLSPQLDYGHTAIGRQGSLLAAKGAMGGSRKRSESTPVLNLPERYPDEANAIANALSAATLAAKPSSRRNELHPEGGSVPFTTLSRDMYTSRPPVAPEVEEKNRADSLHASAVAMAQGMYKMQQKQIDRSTNAHFAASAAHGRTASLSSAGEEPVPMQFNNLQEAAQKLAQERLAKLYGDHEKNRDFREYYGSSGKAASRLSIRGRPRRRASSEGDVTDDQAQSNKIRAQMSFFSNKLSEVDQKKRQHDRENLIAVAQRNVTKSLHGMDEKVFAVTGKVAPSLLTEWELKAHAAAQAKSETRMENYGKVNIGGGKFMNQSEINLVAARNVQPVLDEINEKAEKERIRQAELKLEHETQARKNAEKKAHDREVKDINKKLKQQDRDERRLKEDEEKAERRAKEQEEKAAKAEEKRLAKEKRKSKDATSNNKPDGIDDTIMANALVATKNHTAEEAGPVEGDRSTLATRRDVASVPATIRTSMEMQGDQRMQDAADSANKDESTMMSPSSPEDGSKVKNWLKTKFSRRMSRGQKPVREESTDKGFSGGAAYTGASVHNGSTTSLENRSSSVREVALAGKSPDADAEERIRWSQLRVSDTSTISSLDGGDEFEEARDNFDTGLAPPPTFPAGPAKGNSSPVRDSKFHELVGFAGRWWTAQEFFGTRPQMQYWVNVTIRVYYLVKESIQCTPNCSNFLRIRQLKLLRRKKAKSRAEWVLAIRIQVTPSSRCPARRGTVAQSGPRIESDDAAGS